MFKPAIMYVVINSCMIPYLFVTTFNKNGYQLYGQKMLESFLNFWPANLKMMVYIENFAIDKDLANNLRILTRDLNAVQDLTIFKNRHKNNQKAHGFWPEGRTAKEFQFDAVRFSHKVFSLYDCFKNPPLEYKSMIWLDGDTITFRPVPDNFLETVAPRNFWNSGVGKQKYGISYLGRSRQHSECGFMSFNKTHPLMPAFWEMFADMYRTDQIFDLAEWHDSFVFDHVRKIFEAKGMINLNLTPKIASGHPFINCDLGLYMDHMKGARKRNGRSRKTERHMKTDQDPDWWK